jgi:anaerobic selenocysteine-containing dehydrogenase
MGPTSALADVVLPVAHNYEFREVGNFSGRGWAYARAKVAEPPGDCASDVEWLSRVGRAAGYGGQLWPDDLAMLESLVRPAGLSWQEFQERGALLAPNEWRKYERRGFATASKKVEIYSEKLEAMGIEPLPVFREPPFTPFSEPGLVEQFPLVLTNGKSPNYYHSGGRNLPSLRKREPDPRVELNPSTAAGLGLSEGDWVRVETPHGSIRQKLALDPGLHPGVAYASFGWWFPERRGGALFDCYGSSINVLTAASPADPAVGAPNLKGVMCRVVRD